MDNIIRGYTPMPSVPRSEVAKVLGFKVSESTLKKLVRTKALSENLYGAIYLASLQRFSESLTPAERACMKAEELAYVALEAGQILSHQVPSIIESAKADYDFTARTIKNWEGGRVKGFKPKG